MAISPDLERASEYRSRAANFTKEAAAHADPKISSGLLSVAASYQRLAEIIECARDLAIVQSLAKPTVPELGREMAAAVVPLPPEEPKNDKAD